MHLAPYFFLLALTISTATAAKILGIAGGVYAVLQVAKKIFPSLAGPWALALNFALSVGGVLIAVPPDKLLSVDTLVSVLTAVAAAAGIHGTVKNVSDSSSTSPAPTSGS
jgi:hypothetical protein